MKSTKTQKEHNNCDSNCDKFSISPRDVFFDSHIIKDTLCPEIWDGAQMKKEIREKLLDIGKRFHAYLKVDAPVIDIILTGSLAIYNYNSSSDLDVHVILDYNLVGTPQLAKNLLLTKKILWNRLRKNVRVRNREVELYAQSKDEDHKATGQFSILKNQWIQIPEKQDVIIDEHTIKTLIALFQYNIEKLSFIQDTEERYAEAIRIKDNILKLRRASIESGGEFALGNLVFKSLRNSEGAGLTKLFDIIASSYDNKLSLAELSELSGQLLTEEITSSDEKKIRELIKKELEPMLKKHFSTRPILSKTEIERIAQSKVKKELKDNLTLKDVKALIRQTLLAYHKFMWEKKGIWLNQI